LRQHPRLRSAGSRATADASTVAARGVEDELRTALGAQRYLDMRRDLAAIADMNF
jgi:hypothetical protein